MRNLKWSEWCSWSDLKLWAETDCPEAVERELHERHMDKFGKLPTYTKRT